MKVPNKVDLLKELASGRPSNFLVHTRPEPYSDLAFVEGLQAAATEQVVPKVSGTKKKGKKSGARNRPAKLTNTHLRDMGIDLSKDYVAPGK